MDLRREHGFYWPDLDLPTSYERYVKFSCNALVPVQFCERMRVVIQAGGHCGLWAKKLAGQFENVYTFEPDAHNFKALMANVTERNIFPFRGFLGAGAGFAGIHNNERNTGGHWIEGAGDIPILSIDSFHFKNVDLIILDIEGAELFALRGAVDTIKKYKPVLMLEDNGCGKTKCGYDPVEIELLLKDLGYKYMSSINYDNIWVHDEGCASSSDM